jgi:hypothetical protein
MSSTITDEDDDEVVLGVIDSAMILAMEKLRDQLTEAGGRGEVWACNAKTHDSYFGCATEVMRLPMVVREWVPDRQVVISSLADLDSLADVPMKEGVNE